MRWWADVNFKEDYITFSDASTVLVFKLKDSTDMHKKQMDLNGAPAKKTKTIHATLFKGEIVEPAPGL